MTTHFIDLYRIREEKYPWSKINSGKSSGLDLDDECSSSIMEGSSNASHEHIIEVSILLFLPHFFS